MKKALLATLLICMFYLFAAVRVSAVDYVAGDGSLNVYGGDLDRDGDIDLVVANALANTFSVLMNNGDGTFAAHMDYSTSVVPMSVQAVDLNGDGYLDIVTANRNGDTISVFINKLDGTFNPKVDYAVGDGPYCAIGTDIDGDGDLDIVTANAYANTISVLTNNGAGVFSSPTYYNVGTSPRHIAAGDLNRDGKMDLVVANTQDSTMSVLLNSASGLQTPVQYNVPGASFSAVAVGDVNGDEWRDIVASDGNGNCLRVFLNLGDGSFGQYVTFADGLVPHGVACADIDGDGDVDAVIANTNGNGVGIHLNDGTGDLAVHYDYPVGTAPFSVFCSDFNGDGHMDIATANYGADTVSVLLNGREFTHIYTPPPANADLSVTKTGPTQVITGGTVIYMIPVTNEGPNAANNVVLTDGIPNRLTFNATASSSGYTVANNKIIYNMGTILNGASISINIAFNIPSGMVGTVENTVSVSSDTADPRLGNNGATVSTQIIYAFRGFLPPLKEGEKYNLGRVIPIKFQLFDAKGNPISTATCKSITANGQPIKTAGSTRLCRYDETSQQYITNWSTNGLSPGVYELVVIMGDNISHSITISLNN